MKSTIFTQKTHHKGIEKKRISLLYAAVVTLSVAFFPLSSSSQTLRSDSAFANFLVELAWEYSPTREIANREIEIADLEIKSSNRGYFDAITPFFNTSVGNGRVILDMDGNPVQLANFGGNVGLSLRIFPLLTTPLKTKQAQEKKQIELAERRLEEQQLKTEVLARYERYMFYLELLQVRTRAESDAEINHQLIQELFRKQQIEFDDLNTASRTLEEAMEKRLQAASDIRLAKIQLEELLGISLEEAQRQFALK